MADIKIHREHALGLTGARQVAQAWAEEVESRFDMSCSVLQGKAGDTVEFSRSGVKGTLVVAGDHFDLHAKLGLLLGAFSKTIEAEIQKALDAQLAKGAAAKPAPKAVPKKK